jgi:cytochrome P450
MVLEEVLRLYPPAWILGRRALATDELAGYPIPAGSTVLISIYNIHRHPAFWVNPEGFDPARFEPERKQARHRYAFIPFGSGPRLCIGNNFALMEAALITAMVTQRYRLDLLPGYPVEPEVAFTLRPAGPIWMTLARRDG